jgi:hypothetical protein
VSAWRACVVQDRAVNLIRLRRYNDTTGRRGFNKETR